MDTIFAPATPPGRSGVAVLRVSGERAAEALTALGLTRPPPRMASLVTPINPHTGETVDSALVLFFPAPASFTGEDVVEFHLHGSRAVMAEMLAVLGELEGFRLAQPGEFSRRAFYHGKLDLTRAEAVADLIDAETRAQKQQALRQFSGALARECEMLRQGIVQARAHLEAYLDFPDEEIPEEVAASLNEEIRALSTRTAALLGDARAGEKIRDGYYATILGVPNAGKSTLINALTKRDVAIVSDQPGTTRDIVEAHLDLGGYPLTLADTAGLRNADGIVEAEGIRRARERASSSDFRLVVIDAAAPRSRQALLAEFITPDDVVIFNKCDSETLYIDEFQDFPHALRISAATGRGLEDLISALGQRMEKQRFGAADAVITRARHRLGFEAALLCLERARGQEMPELKGEELRLAGNHLGKILGAVQVEEVLDAVFSSFCIGK